jgi:hypothetical protein
MRIARVLPFLVAASCGGGRQDMSKRMEDMNRMRMLASLFIVASPVPMKDGALDPYAFVGTGDLTRQDYDTFRSASQGKGPTDEQIERGDYTSFPWERYRGDAKKVKGLPTIPLLWEKEPGANGQHLVAQSDGSCRFMDPVDLQAALKR